MGGEDLSVIATAFRFYSQEFWWMAILDLIRRLTPALMIVIEDQFLQILTGLIVLLGFAVFWGAKTQAIRRKYAEYI